MTFTRQIQSRRVLIECDATLAPAVDDVFETLARITRAGTALREGLRIRFGWSMLILAAGDDGLRVCEPLFSGDAVRDANPTLDITLRVLASQVRWLHLLGEDGEDVFFDQQLVAAPNALSAPALFALRGKSSSEADSGWSLAPVPKPGEPIDTSQLSAVPIYSLAVSHPDLLSVLTLPRGYLVTLENNRVAEITGPDGGVRWPDTADLSSGPVN